MSCEYGLSGRSVRCRVEYIKGWLWLLKFGRYNTGTVEDAIVIYFFKNGPYPASFSLFLSFQYTVDSKQMFNININVCR